MLCKQLSRRTTESENLVCFFADTTTARQLQQVNQRCAPGCAAGRCELDSTTGGYRCTKCLPSLVLHYLNGTCGCPAGRYAGIDACVDCDKGSYCIGGTYTGSGEPHQVSCTTHSNDLTTLGKRSINRRACGRYSCLLPKDCKYALGCQLCDLSHCKHSHICTINYACIIAA